MQKKLFPADFISHSIEHYTFRIRRRSQAIYLILLLSVAGALAGLPFIYTDVGIQARGQLTTSGQNYQLNSTVGGFLLSYKLSEGGQVQKGDTLLTLSNKELLFEVAQLQKRLKELALFERDLERLVSVAADSPLGNKGLESIRYRLAYQQFSNTLQKQQLEIERLKTIRDRQLGLFEERVVSQAEMERDQAAYTNAVAERQLLFSQSMNGWKQEALEILQEQSRLNVKDRQLAVELTKYTMVAPEGGFLQNVMNLRAGQFLAGGTRLANLSPASTPDAEIWVSPRDIGLVRQGQSTLIRVYAYNANEWGFLSADIKSVSSDIYMINQKPFYRVICHLKNTSLHLKNGAEGKLKKGMTLQAYFNVARRSLYQLLYDKIDNWLNPQMMVSD